MAISFRTWPVLFTQSSPNIPNPPFSASNLSGIIIWTTGEEKLSSMVASDALLIILSAVSSSAELLSSEIKTFVNLVAQQWREGNHLGREARAGCWKARREQPRAWMVLLSALSSRTYWGPVSEPAFITVTPSAPSAAWGSTVEWALFWNSESA